MQLAKNKSNRVNCGCRFISSNRVAAWHGKPDGDPHGNQNTSLLFYLHPRNLLLCLAKQSCFLGFFTTPWKCGFNLFLCEAHEATQHLITKCRHGNSVSNAAFQFCYFATLESDWPPSSHFSNLFLFSEKNCTSLLPQIAFCVLLPLVWSACDHQFLLTFLLWD